jgi:hypothetical protein
VSRDFSKEITTTALWLLEQGLQIRCLQVLPYKLEGRLYLDFRQVIPLATAEEYQVRLRQKDAHARQEARQTRERTLSILARTGAIQSGSEIEVVPEALPSDAATRGPNIFRARIGDLEVRDSIIWLHDGKPYSLSALSNKLMSEHGFKWVRSNTFYHWRIIGHPKSMWDEAELRTKA